MQVQTDGEDVSEEGQGQGQGQDHDHDHDQQNGCRSEKKEARCRGGDVRPPHRYLERHEGGGGLRQKEEGGGVPQKGPVEKTTARAVRIVRRGRRDTGSEEEIICGGVEGDGLEAEETEEGGDGDRCCCKKESGRQGTFRRRPQDEEEEDGDEECIAL